MDSRASFSPIVPAFYLPQTGQDGSACVIVTRANREPETHHFQTKEEACFWAKQWMRRERLAALEGHVFGTPWIAPRCDH